MAYQNPHLNITVVDRDAARIKQWKSKHLPIYEPGLHKILRIARDGSKACTFYNETSKPDSLESMSSNSSDVSSCESQCAEHREEITIPARLPNLFFSTEVSRCISEADIVLIAINTPTKMRGVGAGRATDMTALEAVTREIALHAKPGAILVEKSTVPCRTADLIAETVRLPTPATPLNPPLTPHRSKSTAQTCPSRSSPTPNSWRPVRRSTTSSTLTA
jgi:UDPglucose 6-dehydrogenase